MFGELCGFHSSRESWWFQGLGSAHCWFSGGFGKIVNNALPHSNRSMSHRPLPNGASIFSFPDQRNKNSPENSK